MTIFKIEKYPNKERYNMSLKIPPVVQFIFFASLSWILKTHFPVFTLNHVILDYFAAGLALAGFL